MELPGPDMHEPPPGDPWPAPPARTWAWAAVVAWVVIVAMCLFAAFMHRFASSSAGPEDEDTVGLTVMQIQAKYMVGVANLEFLPMDGPAVYSSARLILNAGTVDQRQRAIIVAADLTGSLEASRELGELDELIADPPVGEPVELTEAQASVQRILHALYESKPGDDDDEEATRGAVAALSPAERGELVERLGWFGELALAPAGAADTTDRDAVLRTARIVASVVLTVAVLAVGAVIAGLIGLVLLLVFTFTGVLRSGMGRPRDHHGVYAETFALWMVLFFGLQFVAGLVATAAPAAEMLVTGAMFFVSLIALGWPVLRGLRWATVRRDIGWTAGRLPWVEPLIGVGGYLATLPLLAVGLVLTLGLMAVQGAMAGEPPTFAPTGGPAHPIIVYMSGDALLPKILVLLLAAVAAPIVEETMFRGVLYRHLRDVSARLGLVGSVVVSTALNAFIFAAIHPQGLVAVPALGALAAGMVLVREWRGTLIPSMVIHGVANGLIMGILLTVLSV